MSSPLLAIPSPVIQTPETILLVPITYPPKKKNRTSIIRICFGISFQTLIKKRHCRAFFLLITNSAETRTPMQ